MIRDPLEEIVAELDRAAIDYMLAGSFASSFHGAPRTTHDIDIVMAPTRDRLDRFVRELDPELYYVSEIAVEEAWRRRGMFNVISLESGWKIDLILRKDRAFSRAEFDRRIRVDLAGLAVWMATAEDTVIAKLEWAKTGESERQLRDVAGIVSRTGDRLDRPYVEYWVETLGLTEQWWQVTDTER